MAVAMTAKATVKRVDIIVRTNMGVQRLEAPNQAEWAVLATWDQAWAARHATLALVQAHTA